jgi:carboxymethylenebutenolidase
MSKPAKLHNQERHAGREIPMTHEWWGLNDYIKQEAARFAQDLSGVNVIALDLYHGKTVTTADEAGKLMQAVNTDRVQAIIKGPYNMPGPKRR